MDATNVRYPETHERPPAPPSRLRRWLLRASVLSAIAVAAFVLLADAPPAVRAAGGFYFVTSDNDVNDGTCAVTPGHCSLREAIIAANADPGSQIHFNIPCGGPCTTGVVHTIAPATTLPTISQTTRILGNTQPGWSSGRPVIDLDGGNTVTTGLRFLNVVGGEVAALIVRRFTVIGVQFDGGSDNGVFGSFIGTDPTGTLDHGNQIGLLIVNSSGNDVGVLVGSSRNTISGNDVGIRIDGAPSTGNHIYGNRIGTTRFGGAGLGNTVGIEIRGAATGNHVGNYTSGSNTIAYNTLYGVYVWGAGTTGNRIGVNSIYANTSKGIETASGGNAELTPPSITGATYTGGASGTACFSCTVDVYSNDACGQGRRFERRTTASSVTGAWSVPGPLAGPYLAATATSLPVENTSEFSSCYTLSTLSPVPRLRRGAELTLSLDDRTPLVQSDAQLDLRYPGFDPGGRNLVAHLTGSTITPYSAGLIGATVGQLWVDIDYCGLGHYTISAAGAGGLANGIPLRYANRLTAQTYLPAGWNTSDIVAAVQARGVDVALYDSAGAAVAGWSLGGEAYGFVLDSSLGGHDLVFGEIGSDTRLSCVRVVETRLNLRGTIDEFSYFRKNGPAGFYRGFATYDYAVSPYAQPIDSELVQGCDYVDTTPPASSVDVDGDCLETPTDSDDANPNQDGDGAYDGIEFAAGTSMTLADTDGDGVPDAKEIKDRTSSTASSDFDGDGVADGVDNCPKISNASQSDIDFDGKGDACDDDKDGDGLTNKQEASMKLTTIASPASKKALRCDFGPAPTLALNSANRDTDGDGWIDGAECTLGSDPTNAASVPEICNGVDDDGDGLTDEGPTPTGLYLDYDTNPANCVPADPDGDGAMGITEKKIRTINRINGEWEDLPSGVLLCTDPNVDCNPDGDAFNSDVDSDSDNDGLPDLVEFGKYGTSPANIDTDGDGINDGIDNCPNSNLSVDQTNNDAGVTTSMYLGSSTSDYSNPSSDSLGNPCDPDDDNDGVSDAEEINGYRVLLSGGAWACNPLSAGPGGGTSVGEAGGLDIVVANAHLRPDIDGDGARDGAECKLGSDPTNQLSPSASGCTTGAAAPCKVSVPERCPGAISPWFYATNGDEDRDGVVNEGCPGSDADSDGLLDAQEAAYGGTAGNADTDGDSGASPVLRDGGEAIYLGTGPGIKDSDGDGCVDQIEAIDIGGGLPSDPNYRISATDAGVVYAAANYNKVAGVDSGYKPVFDLNHDGRVSATDAGIVYSSALYNKRCSDFTP